jgi:hypothetical protein
MAEPGTTTTGADLARLLADLADVLIPGDGGRWPSASQAGVQGVLAARLLEVRGPRGVDELAAAIQRCGGPLADRSAAERVAIVARFEAEDAGLFALVRTAGYLAYYESPAIVGVIAALGHAYRPMPHAEGYSVPPFDSERDRPRHGRGRLIATAEVRRVDLSGLDFLGRSQGTDHGES